MYEGTFSLVRLPERREKARHARPAEAVVYDAVAHTAGALAALTFRAPQSSGQALLAVNLILFQFFRIYI